MRKYCLVILTGVELFIESNRLCGATVFQEDFASNPTARAWRAYGDGSLFRWDETSQALDVTWDSARPNSYFARPLNSILSRADDFSLAFDLRLRDIAVGTNPGKPFTFQLAIGFINLAEATATNFLRGTGTDSPDLAEFDYFPDSGFGATIAPTMISSNVQFATSFNSPLELTTNVLFHVTMSYTASNQTLVTLMTRDGMAFGPIADVRLDTNFTDFRADHFAISSYTDGGQDPQFAGSILAHGVVDNIAVTAPDPPILNLGGQQTNGAWRMQFTGSTNWLYTLERTEDFRSWNDVGLSTPGVAGPLILSDTNVVTSKAFYRVRARRAD